MKNAKTKRISALVSLLLVVTVLFSGNVFAGESRSSERKFVVSDAELESYLSNTSDEMTLAKYSDYLLDESIDFTMTQTELIELIATTCYLDPSVFYAKFNGTNVTFNYDNGVMSIHSQELVMSPLTRTTWTYTVSDREESISLINNCGSVWTLDTTFINNTRPISYKVLSYTNNSYMSNDNPLITRPMSYYNSEIVLAEEGTLEASVKWRFETETGRKLELYTRSID